MKKHYYYILLFFAGSLGFTLTGCSDILNTSPRDVLTDGSVWSSPEAIQAYLGKLYDSMQTEDLGHGEDGFDTQTFQSLLTDEAVRSYTWGIVNDPVIHDNGFKWWGYNQMRNVNMFLDRIKTAPIEEQSRITYEAEARFIRAFYYFSMVKRYGGVPLITEAQEYTGSNIEELKVPRNTEKEIYDFIRTEVDEIAEILPVSWKSSAANKYRATRYAALALKSRAMLYAASIATYSQVELNGLVGIPAGDKDFYWEESKKASEKIMTSGEFSLYNATADKEANFQNLFLEKDMHSEAIFTKAFLSPDRTHSFDFYNAPQSFKVDYGCAINPVLELVENFEYIDGTPGKLKVNDAAGNPIAYSNPYDLFKDKDPRLMASIIVPFASWQGGILEIRKGIIDGSNVITAADLTTTYGTGDNQIPIVGKDGPLDINDPTKTGFYIKKFMNPTDRVNQNRSDTYWMVFRYGEILLNYAEACMELGQTTEALKAINEIRERAGISKKATITLQDVRSERKVELAFENHRWWDMRRWRISDQVLNNKEFFGLYPYLVWENGKHPSEMKYIFKVEPAPKNTRTFLPKLYYVKIAADQIRTNPKLVQNPGY